MGAGKQEPKMYERNRRDGVFVSSLALANTVALQELISRVMPSLIAGYPLQHGRRLKITLCE